MQIVGKRIPRLDGKARVTGTTTYTINIEKPGMLYGRILRSVYPHARIIGIDTSRAEQLPGVVAVLTGKELASWDINPYFGSLVKDQPVLAMDKVRYVGDPVAAVAAVSEEVAEAALELIEVEYEELPAVFSPEEALEDGAPLLHGAKTGGNQELVADAKGVQFVEGSNIVSQFKLRKGDVEQGFAQADYVFEDEFTTPAATHAHLEPHVALAEIDANGAIDIWSATQTPTSVRTELAHIFKLPLSQVRVRVADLGGGYGGKCYARIEPIAVALAMKAGRPVKIVLPREEVFLTLTKHAARIRVKTGVMRDGTIVSRQITSYWDTGAYADVGPRVMRNGSYPGAGPYRIPNVRVDAYCVYTNKIPAGAYRGYGVTQAGWAMESHMDMIARRLNMDPLAFRLKNCLHEGDSFHTGQTVEHLPIEELLQKAADAIGWDPSRNAWVTKDGKLRGRGIACSVKGTMTPSASTAIIKMNEDGSASVLTSTVEIGQGSNTALAQIAAEALALPIEKVRVIHPDTAVTPYDRATSSSRSTFMMGNAIVNAAEEVKAQLLEAAAELLEVSAEDLTLFEGHVQVKGSPDRSLSYEDVIRRKYGMKVGSIVGRGNYVTEGGLDPETGQGVATVFWEAGATASEVEVDPETGSVKVIHLAAVCDVGSAINPMACEGQIEGTVANALGHTFFENILYESGQPINPNFLDYPLPTVAEMPEKMEAILLELPHPNGPFGAHGVGETMMPSVAPSIANAIEAATGVRIQDLPITPQKLLAELLKDRRIERVS